MVRASLSISGLWVVHVQRAWGGVCVSTLHSGHWSDGKDAGLVLCSLVLQGSVLLRV